MSIDEKIQQLDEHVGSHLRKWVREVQEQLGRRLNEEITRQLEEASNTLPTSVIPAEELASIAAAASTTSGSAALRGLRDALTDLDRAGTQAEILGELLAGGRLYASRRAIFLVRNDLAIGWSAQGFGEADLSIPSLELSIRDGGPFDRLTEGRAALLLSTVDCGRLCSRLETALPLEGVLIPLVLRGQVAAALYADRSTGDPPLGVEGLQILTYTAALAIETLVFRTSKTQSPTLIVEGEEAVGGATEVAWISPPSPVTSTVPTDEASPATEALSPPEVVASTTSAADLWEDSEEEPWTEPESSVPVAVLEEIELEVEADEQAFEPAEPWADAPVSALDTTLEQGEEVGMAAVGSPTPLLDELMGAAAAQPPRGGLPWVEEEEIELEPAPAVAEPWAVSPAEPWQPEPPVESPLLESSGWTVEPEPPPSAVEARPEEQNVASYFGSGQPSAFGPSSLASDGLQTISYSLPVEPTVDERDETVLLSRPASFGTAPQTVPATGTAFDGDETHPGEGGVSTASDDSLGTGVKAVRASEVTPPSDVDGPGWAFAKRPPAGVDDELHEKAKRLARLLVSEIKLYNEEQVEEGQRNKDIYERLKEDIDRSRQMYEERVDERVRRTHDYFYQELVRTLAAGDPHTLGI